MLGQMMSRQVTEWRAFYDLEHLGETIEERADLRAGIVAATIANVLRGKGAKAISPEAMMPRFEQPQQSPDQLYAALNARADADARKAARRKAAQEARADGGPVQAKAGRRARSR